MAGRGRPPKAESTEQKPVSTEPILEVKGENGESLLRVDNTDGRTDGGTVVISTTAPQDVKLLQCEVVKEVINSKDFLAMIASMQRCNNMYNDMNSRVQEIENFRNTSSIEGKIRDISEKYDEVLGIVGQLKAEIQKLTVK